MPVIVRVMTNVPALYGVSVDLASYCSCYEHTYQPYMEVFVHYPCFLVIVHKRTIDFLLWDSLNETACSVYLYQPVV